MITKTNIGVYCKVEGFHNFPNAIEAFGDDVDFLSVRHRHNFGITVEVKVRHDDRDKEFILLQREIKDYIKRTYGEPAEFDSMSCEAIGRDILEAFDAESVKVDEDGENYAIVKQIRIL